MGVLENILMIQNTYRDTSSRVSLLKSTVEINHYLATETNELLSLKYEAASAVIGRRGLNEWGGFLDNHLEFASQIYVGLGWAAFESGRELITHTANLNSEGKWKLVDGFGYASSILNRRETIRKQLYPDEITEDLKDAFDEGVGRSLFYFSKGGIDKLKELLSLFEVGRLQGLWRGIGLASAYVGGGANAFYIELNELANNYSYSYRTGAFLALQSLKKAGDPTYKQKASVLSCIVDPSKDLLSKASLDYPEQIRLLESAL